MKRMRLAVIILIFLSTLNVWAEKNDPLKDICKCDNTSDYRNILLKHACLNYCREKSSKPSSGAQVGSGSGGFPITWPVLPEPPKTNPFQDRLPDHGLYDLEMFRLGNEQFRMQVEDKRVLLETFRNNNTITIEQYLQQMDKYKSSIFKYQEGIKTYKDFNLDVQRMGIGE